jgi:hypothetical protein
MSDHNIAAFPQHRAGRGKPIVANIVRDGLKAGKPPTAIFETITTFHPNISRTEFEAAVTAGINGLNDDPPEPIWEVAEEIVEQTLNAIDPSQTPRRLSLVKATGPIRQHSRQIEIISWLAQAGLEKELLNEAEKRGMNYYFQAIAMRTKRPTTSSLVIPQGCDECHQVIAAAVRNGHGYADLAAARELFPVPLGPFDIAQRPRLRRPSAARKHLHRMAVCLVAHHRLGIFVIDHENRSTQPTRQFCKNNRPMWTATEQTYSPRGFLSMAKQ